MEVFMVRFTQKDTSESCTGLFHDRTAINYAHKYHVTIEPYIKPEHEVGSEIVDRLSNLLKYLTVELGLKL